MPLDAGQTPMSVNDTEMDDLRRRAGITPAYAKMNPPPMMVPISEPDLIALLAALEQIEQSQEMVPVHPLVQKFKKLLPQRKPPEPARPKPNSNENPYYQTAVQKPR